MNELFAALLLRIFEGKRHRIALGAALLAMMCLGSPIGAVHAADDSSRPNIAKPAEGDATSPSMLAPASAAVLREFALLHRCRQEMHARGPDKFDQVEPECALVQAKLMDGGGYDLAYRAAELGDSAAAQCFVAGAFPMPPKMQARAGMLDEWRLDAAHIIERGIARGDWHMVYAAKIAYGAPEVQRQPRFEPPFHEPGLYLLWTIGGEDGVAATAYRAMQLLALGAESSWDAENYRQDAAQFASRLSAKERRAADDWARKAFRTQFGGRTMRQEDTDFCLLPQA